MRLTSGARAAAAAVVAGCMVVSAVGEARGQVVEDPTTTSTTLAPPTTTTVPPPPTTTSTSTTTTTQPAPNTSTSTTAPAFEERTTPATAPPAPAAITTTRPPAAPPARPVPPVADPPAVGGDAAPPPGTAPEIPPELQAKIDSVRRSGPNSSAKLVAALTPLVAMGMTEQEAIQAGFGRFPVGGRATFTDDWWYPRFTPSIHLHEGTDIFAAYGTPARAPATGTLRQSFNAVGGLSAYVTEPDGTYYYLAHLSRYEPGQVSGQPVEAGDVIGYVGDSGNARGTSPHVHFEIHPRGGGPTNPKRHLDAWLEEALAAVPSVVASAAPTLVDRGRTPAEEQDLTVVGHSDLGGRGSYGDVAVVADTALVATGDTTPRPLPAGSAEPGVVAGCEASVTVVDLAVPASPRVAGTISLLPGERVEDIAALEVQTPKFTGNLAAVAVGPCRPGDGATGLAVYDVTDASDPKPVGRVPHPRRLADQGAAVCGTVLRGTCPRTDRTVDLQLRPDGRVVSLSRAPALTDEAAPEAFVVDLSTPFEPLPLGFVSLGRRDRAPAVDDGCSPVRLSPPARPPAGLGPLVDISGFALDTETAPTAGLALDAAAGYTAVADGNGRRLAVSAEGAWWSASWGLRIDPAAQAGGGREGCARPLSSSSAGAGPTAGELVYVGRGCPSRPDVDGATIAPDPYLADPTGRIAVSDAALAPSQHGLSGRGCTAASRLARAREAGALGLVVAGSFLADVADAAPAGAAEAEGAPGRPGAIPAVLLRKPDGDALRNLLCPPAPDPAAPCGPGAPVAADLVELPGRWSGLRILDVTDADEPREVGVYRTASAAATTPADPTSSYAVEAAVTDGSRVYVAWGSDGLRVLDLASGLPSEVGSFVPPAPPVVEGVAPAAPHAVGVGRTDDHIVVSDRSRGLWVLDKRPPAGTRGYWLADADGGVNAFGDAEHHGSADGLELSSPVVGLAPSPTGGGYWLATADGGVHAFGDAAFAGSLAGAVTSPVVGIAATPTGKGYWLAAADGGVFAFGDADFLGSTAATPPVAPVVGAAGTTSGRGYWLVAADGGVFAFGDARFKGTAPNRPPGSPVVGVAAMTGVRGYWLAGADGRVDALGTPNIGARDNAGPSAPRVVAVAAVPRPPAPVPPARPPRRPLTALFE